MKMEKLVCVILLVATFITSFVDVTPELIYAVEINTDSFDESEIETEQSAPMNVVYHSQKEMALH